jgi:predicted phosphodiesterase
MSRFTPRIWAAVAAICAVAGIYAASRPPQAFRFVIFGDRTGETRPGVYEQIWREVDSERPDFVMNVGDTIQGGQDGTAEAEWRALRPLFERYSRYPLYFTPGNHDIWSPDSRRIYEHATRRPAHYGFDYEDAHFTVLDNSESDELNAGELDFLELDVAAHKAQSPKFVVFHRPSWLIPVLFQNSGIRLHQIAKKYGIGYVISGHVHKFTRLEMESVVYLMVGSSGAHLRGAKFEEGWFYHHVLVKVAGDQARLTVKEAHPPFGQGRSFSAESWKDISLPGATQP